MFIFRYCPPKPLQSQKDDLFNGDGDQTILSITA